MPDVPDPAADDAARPERPDAPSSVEALLADVEVRRSARRRRTVTAFRERGRTVVAIPARFTAAQEREWVRRMVDKLAAQERRRRPSDDQLAARAAALSDRYLGGAARPTSVRWSDNQDRRWGSCTPTEGSIRISSRVRGLPVWVLDYVLVHELAHLLHHGHGPDFWALVHRYPRAERARGFLEGIAFSDEGAPRPDGDTDDVDDVDEVGDADDVAGADDLAGAGHRRAGNPDG